MLRVTLLAAGALLGCWLAFRSLRGLFGRDAASGEARRFTLFGGADDSDDDDVRWQRAQARFDAAVGGLAAAEAAAGDEGGRVSAEALRAALTSAAPSHVHRRAPSATRTASTLPGQAVLARYKTLPWRMVPQPAERRGGGSGSGGDLRCFASPYWQGATRQQRALAAQTLVDAVAYPPGPLAAERTQACQEIKGVHVSPHTDDCPPDAVCAPAEAAEMKHWPHAADERITLTSTYEVAYELLAAAPYGYALSLNGHLARTVGVPGSSAFYFWSPDHCERAGSARAWQPLNDAVETPWPHSSAHSTVANALVTIDSFRIIADRWRLPPFHGHYCGSGLFWWASVPHVVVFNKRPATEWGAPPVNVLSDAALAELFDALSPRYVVVYVRPPPGLVSEDQGTAAVHDDIDALVAHARAALGEEGAAQRLVLFNAFLGDLAAAGAARGVDVNTAEVTLSALAEADGYIAVQGAPAYLSLLWGPSKRVVLFEAKGMEVTLNSAQWYAGISGTEHVVSVRYPEALRAAVEEAFLSRR